MKSTVTHCNEYAQVSRRAFLSRGMQAAAAMFAGPRLWTMPEWMPRIKLADPHVGPRGDTLVCVFLRGGADGLNMVVPHGDDAYYDLRPTLGIPRPDALSASAKTVDLDGFFGLHPALASLSHIYQAGDVAFVHATGSPDETRSHFEAMDLMERGVTQNGDYSGWLARHLATLDTGNESALRAVGVGEVLPASLTGTVSATALQAIADYHLHGRDERIGDMQTLLAALYNQQEDVLTAVANQTFAAIDVLSKVDTEQPGNGSAYPERDFGRALQTVAQLIKADVGLEVACIDLVGWDTHVAQGATEGPMPNLMSRLAAGLTAFYEDLQSQMDGITLVVMSEFGRRANENGGLGTDHGHGNMMMIMGGGINGGQVFADWPGLQPEQLTGPGDLTITTDYRDILGELLRKRLNNPQITAVFPNYAVNEIGLAVPRT
ncbi:MAG: hypothetical protein CSA11_08260 [Chloroflexi bacterium]|nr:MAG: hypothetical protein CSA11_08260 [Chloroflexota bacterium]